MSTMVKQFILTATVIISYCKLHKKIEGQGNCHDPWVNGVFKSTDEQYEYREINFYRTLSREYLLYDITED